MTRGRKPISNAVRKLHGTDRADRMKEEISSPVLVSVDARKIKALQTKRGREIFTVKAKQLISQGVLTELDIEALTIYANSLDMLFECVEKVKEEKFVKVVTEKGTTYISNPYLKLYKEMADIVNRVGADFGFTPVSRLRIQAPIQEDDQLAELMRQFH